MKLSNLWKSWIQSRRRQLRRKPAGEIFRGHFAAEVLETRELLSGAVPAVTVTVQSGNLTVTSTDSNSPNLTISRSGNNINVSSNNGTQITYGTTVATSQNIVLAAVNNLTVNLGTGTDTISIVGVGTTGSITINGQSSGIANISIHAGTPNIVIGGSIQANLGSEVALFGLFGSYNGGGSLTVNGSVSVTEAGAGSHQVNLSGPPAGNPLGGKLAIAGGVSVFDTGSGPSGLHIDDGVTIGGNVSFDNSANTVNGDTIQIYSNSNAYGTTSITGTLNLALSQAVYHGDTVTIQGYGSPLAVNGAVTINSGGGGDNIELANVWFKTTAGINTGISPSFANDVLEIDGSRFDGATTVSMGGPFSQLNLGTNSTFGVTTFNSTFAASVTGANAMVQLSNATSTVNEVVFNSTAAFTGGTPYATLTAAGKYYAGVGKLTKANFYTTPIAAAPPNVTVTVSGSNVTVMATDIRSHNITIYRAGNYVVVAGANGTQVTYGSKIGSSESVAVTAVNNLTVDLGPGNDTLSIYGLSTTGSITINGQATGVANISIDAGSPNVVIGGSIVANLGGESATFGLFGSYNGGGNLTVNGSVTVTESGAGNQQVNIYGPPANNALGGKLAIKGSLSVSDTGSGVSGLHIDDGVTISGNVSFDNSANTVNGDNVQIYSNSNAYGITSIAGTLTLALSQAVYQGDAVWLQAFGTPLTVTGAVSITTGGGNDGIELADDWFKSTTAINTGSSPGYANDAIGVDGSRFDGAVTIAMAGPFSQLNLGTSASFGSTYFNGTFAASVTGANSLVVMSNSTLTYNQVIFVSTAKFTGGTTYATLVIQGRYYAGVGKLTKTNFN
jgi:hypothetical protein